MANVIVFPETDQAEWLNKDTTVVVQRWHRKRVLLDLLPMQSSYYDSRIPKIIHQLWPYLGDFLDDILKKNVEPKIKESVLGSFAFSKVDMGTKPLRIEGVKVYSIREGEIYMDLDINYTGDADIDVDLIGISNAAGIQHITLKGTLRVTMKPLLSAAPLIGGVSFFFITNPTLEFDLTNLANVMDIPFFKEKLQAIIQGQLSNMLVFPKRMEYVVGEGTKFDKIHCPRPQGVLKIHIVEAKDLRDADTLGKNSDPYAIVTVGDQTFQTETIENQSNPKWDQTFDALVDLAEEHLTIKIMDRDTVAADDSLGHATVDISRVIENGKVDDAYEGCSANIALETGPHGPVSKAIFELRPSYWFKLEGVDTGDVHLDLQWFYLANDVTMLQTEGDCPRCLLMICIHSAQGLLKAEPDQKAEKKAEDLKVKVVISFMEQEFTSTEATSAPNPSWEEDFRFLMTCAEGQNLNIKVKDSKKDTVYGTVDIDIKDLIASPDMALDQSYPLITEIPDITPEISMKMVLRVLTPDTDPRWLADSFQ